MKRNTHIPRHDPSNCKYHNVTLVGGFFDGTLLDNFRGGQSNIHVMTGIYNGIYQCAYYRLDEADHSKAYLCDLRGNYV